MYISSGWFADCEILKFSMTGGLENQLKNMTFSNTKELFLFGQCQNPITDLVAKMPKLQSFHIFAECPIPLVRMNFVCTVKYSKLLLDEVTCKLVTW